MSETKGFIGEYGTDGYVTYITVDCGNSYLPTIHCGSFELVIGRGSHWTGVGDGAGESRGVIMAAAYDRATDEDPGENVTEVTFEWSEAGFLAAVASVLEDLELADYEHPAPHNVLDAARELWIALRLEGKERF